MAKGANIVRLLGIAVPTNMNSLGTIAPVEDLIFFVLSFALYYRCTEDPNPNLTKDDKLAPDADKFVLSRVKQSKARTSDVNGGNCSWCLRPFVISTSMLLFLCMIYTCRTSLASPLSQVRIPYGCEYSDAWA